MEHEERDKAVDAYEQAWKAFYAWNSEDAQRILSSLGGESTTVSSDSVSGSVSGEGGDAANEWVVPDERVVSEDESWLQTFTEESTTTVRITRPVVLCDSMEPAPRYNSCDVVMERLYLGENERVSYPRVVPFCDDPTFDSRNYLEELAPREENDGEERSRSDVLRRFEATKPLAEREPHRQWFVCVVACTNPGQWT